MGANIHYQLNAWSVFIILNLCRIKQRKGHCLVQESETNVTMMTIN